MEEKDVKNTTVIEEPAELPAPNIFVFGNKECDVLKRGRAQAEQLVNLTKWLGKYGGKIFDTAADEEGNVDFGNLAGLVLNISQVLDVDALIDLFVLVFGCSKSVANDYFDIAILIDGIIVMFDQSPSFKKVIDRFFSRNTIEEVATKE